MDKENHTSHIDNLPVIGSIATMPSRADTFSRMVPGVLSQVDRLYVFLDGFEAIPAVFQSLPKCHVTILPKQGNLHSSSRFLAPHLFDSEAIVVLFDDDILYPPDYVARIRRALAQYGSQSIIGFQGAIFLPPHHSYSRNRHAIHFSSGLDNDLNVHKLGAGTAAFLSSMFCPDPETWRYNRMDDLYMSVEAVKANLALVALKREANWITPLAEGQEDSLWQATKQDDRIQSDLMRHLLTQYVQPTRNDWWQRP